jgi:hypothetical protein
VIVSILIGIAALTLAADAMAEARTALLARWVKYGTSAVPSRSPPWRSTCSPPRHRRRSGQACRTAPNRSLPSGQSSGSTESTLP